MNALCGSQSLFRFAAIDGLFKQHVLIGQVGKDGIKSGTVGVGLQCTLQQSLIFQQSQVAQAIVGRQTRLVACQQVDQLLSGGLFYCRVAVCLVKR